jgi:hypothetical protein
MSPQPSKRMQTCTCVGRAAAVDGHVVENAETDHIHHYDVLFSIRVPAVDGETIEDAKQRMPIPSKASKASTGSLFSRAINR